MSPIYFWLLSRTPSYRSIIYVYLYMRLWGTTLAF
jgi:hypothetical protein